MTETVSRVDGAFWRELRDVQTQLDRAHAIQSDASPRRDEMIEAAVREGYDGRTIAQMIGANPPMKIYNVVNRIKRKIEVPAQ